MGCASRLDETQSLETKSALLCSSTQGTLPLHPPAGFDVWLEARHIVRAKGAQKSMKVKPRRVLSDYYDSTKKMCMFWNGKGKIGRV